MIRSSCVKVVALALMATGCGRTVDEPPVPPRDAEPPLTGMRIRAGGSWSCSLDASGSAACWGASTDGILSPPAEALADLALGPGDACGILPSRILTCWPSEGFVMRPEIVPTARVARVSVGSSHACMIRAADQQVVCWGRADHGATDAPYGRFMDVAAGTYFSCALRESGELSCWGKNDLGQSTPPAGSFSSVVAGFSHACALDADGAPSCWGEPTGAHGQRARAVAADMGTCIIRPDETVACFGVSKHMTEVPKGRVKGLAIGTAHGCVVRHDDRVECWGSDSVGQASPP